MKKKLYAFLLSAFLVTTSTFAVDLTSGLKLHYTFDDVTDVAIPDASGNGFVATLMGAAAVAEGKTGQAVNLLAAEDYVAIPEGVLSDVTDFTFACWVNLNTINYWGRVFDFGSGEATNLFMAPIDGHFKFVIKKDAEVGEQALSSSIKIDAGQWAHVAVTGSYNELGEGTVKFYVNGALAGTSETFTSTPASMGVTTQNYLGKSQYPDPTINGKIDDFRVYNRALSQEDLMVMNGYPIELINAYNAFTIGNTTDVKENLVLPTTAGTDGVTVAWTTSDSLVVEKDGTIHRLDRFRAAATLTATMSYIVGTDTTSVVKMFDVVVYPINDPVEIIATWNFLDDNIKREDGVTTVTDEVSGYTATCVGGADIVPIGTDEVFNVLSLGTAGGQYLNLGEEIGQAIFGLTDYTVGIFFRKDTTDGSAASWYTTNGQPLYAFSNTIDQESDKVGAMYFEPKRGRHVCTPDNYGSEDGNKVGIGENQTPQGTWHHVAYTQTNGAGALYFDGVEVATGQMLNPSVVLKKNVTGRKGTIYNMLGRPTYKNDSYVKNTLMYGFELYSVGLSADDMEDVLGIQSKIASLDLAYANTTYDVQAFMALQNLLNTAKKAVAVGYEPGLANLNAAIAVGEADATAKTATEASNLVLEEAIKAYNDSSALWVELGKVLGSFEEELALEYPGLADFNKAIADVKAEYDLFKASQELIDALEAARMAYMQTQPASGANPVDYTWALTNASFEENVGGGTLDPDSYRDGKENGNGSYTFPKGWDVYLNHSGSCNCVYYTTDPADGNKLFEIWAATITELDMSQTVDLKAGYYILSGQMRTDAQPPFTQHVYCTTAEGNTYTSKPLVDTLNINGTGWNSIRNWQTLYTVIHTDGGKARVGFNSKEFMQFDNMRLAYYGADAPDTTSFTTKLANPSFEEGTLATEYAGFDSTSVVKLNKGSFFAPVGWLAYAKMDTAILDNCNMVGISGANMAEGSKGYEMWSREAKTFKISQKVLAPATGHYLLTAKARCDASAPSKTDALRYDARLFAKVGNFAQVEGKKFGQGDTSWVRGDWANKDAWQTISVAFKAGIGETITLGALSSSFIQLDDFQLTCFGIPADSYNAPVALERTNKATRAYTVYTSNGVINIAGLTNERVSVYDIAGRQINVLNPSQISVKQGLYFVKINNEVTKVLVK